MVYIEGTILRATLSLGSHPDTPCSHALALWCFFPILVARPSLVFVRPSDRNSIHIKKREAKNNQTSYNQANPIKQNRVY